MDTIWPPLRRLVVEPSAETVKCTIDKLERNVRRATANYFVVRKTANRFAPRRLKTIYRHDKRTRFKNK